MLKLSNGDILRNLEEQVLKNKEDIANHYAIDRNLANFGIKIVGTAASTEDLPGVTEFPLAPNYSGEYGDGYAVGEPGNYTYYIFTRPDLNAGKPTDYWLDVGQISVVGPQGPQGIQGEQGPAGQSTKWYSFTTPPQGGTYNEGDMAVVTQGQSVGNVYRYTNNAWIYTGNIRGPQGPQGVQGPIGPAGPEGPQGPQGLRGDVGGLVNIRGQLTSESQLPSPADLNNLTIAYLVNGDLYIQFGETPQTATWNNVGPFNVGTMVTVNGVYQNVWDANTKAPAKAPTAGKRQVYTSTGESSTWETIMTVPNAQKTPGVIPVYVSAQEGTGANETTKGYLVSNIPKNDYHVATKNYVDNKVGQLHPRPEKVFNYNTEIQANEEVSMTYKGSQGLLNFRWMTISMYMGGGEYVTETLPISVISEAINYKLWKTTYPSKFTIQIENVNSPSPTMKLTNLTGSITKPVGLNVTCF